MYERDVLPGHPMITHLMVVALKPRTKDGIPSSSHLQVGWKSLLPLRMILFFVEISESGRHRMKLEPF
jgi:hypothetical protein